MAWTQVSRRYGDNWTAPNGTVFANNRIIYIATPAGDEPTGGWPCLLYFQFMNKHGWVTESGTPHHTAGGVSSTEDPPGRKTYVNTMHIMQQALAAGVKIISIGQFGPDNMFFSDCPPGSGYENDPTEGCYNNGDNPDFDILSWIFDKIHGGSDPDFGNVDYNNIGLFGTSVAATLVSRCIDTFPTTNTKTGVAYPPVKYGIMVAGGSYACYGYANWNKPPDNFLPCIDKNSRGCCPHNFTEMYYGSVPYTNQTTYPATAGAAPMKNHPPVLLLQSENDKWADPNASVFYYNVMKQGGGPVWKNAYPASYPATQEGDRHGVYEDQVAPAAAFIKNFSQKTPS